MKAIFPLRLIFIPAFAFLFASPTQPRPDQSQHITSREARQVPFLEVAQNQQAHTDSLNATESNKDEEIEIQKKVSSYTGWLVLVGSIQFLALVTQAIVFYRTLRQMQDTDKRQLRAYLCVDNARIKFYSPTLPEAIVTLKNCGKTPAYGAKYQIHLWVGPHPLPKNTILPTPIEIVDEPSAVIGPGNAISLAHQKHPSVATPQTPLGSPASTIYIYGTVAYRDAFQQERHTNFRLSWGGTAPRMIVENGEKFGNPQTEPSGNEAD